MENTKFSIYEKLSCIQVELKCNKSQYNSFGKYNYRNCEDILEAVKPLCKKYRTTLILHDEVEVVSERYYIKAIATIYDWDSDNKIVASAYARESLTKKGMDDSQVTGATSSYARKYALNGLFNIDDTKDADTDAYAKTTKKESKKEIKDNRNVIIHEAYTKSDKFKKVLLGVLNGRKSIDNLSSKEKDDLVEMINTSKESLGL